MSDDKKDTREETNLEDVPLRARHSGKKAFTQLYQSAQFENISSRFGRDSGHTFNNNSNNNMSFENYNSHLTERLNKSGIIFQNGSMVNIGDLEENDNKDDRIRELQLRELLVHKKLREEKAKLEKDSAIFKQRLEFAEVELKEAKQKIKDNDEFFRLFDFDDLKYQQHPVLKQKFSQMAEAHAKELSQKQREIDQLRFQLRTTGQSQNRKILRSSIDSLGSEMSAKKNQNGRNESESEEDNTPKEIGEFYANVQKKQSFSKKKNEEQGNVGENKANEIDDGQEYGQQISSQQGIIDQQKIEKLQAYIQELKGELDMWKRKPKEQVNKNNIELYGSTENQQNKLDIDIEKELEKLKVERSLIQDERKRIEEENITINEQKQQIQQQLMDLKQNQSSLQKSQVEFQEQQNRIIAERNEIKQTEEKGKQTDMQMAEVKQLLDQIKIKEKEIEEEKAQLAQEQLLIDQENSQLRQQMKMIEQDKHMFHQESNRIKEEKRKNQEEKLKLQEELFEFQKKQAAFEEGKDQFEQQVELAEEKIQTMKDQMKQEEAIERQLVEERMIEVQVKQKNQEEQRKRNEQEQNRIEELLEEVNKQRSKLEKEKQEYQHERGIDEQNRHVWYQEQLNQIQNERQRLIEQQVIFEKQQEEQQKQIQQSQEEINNKVQNRLGEENNNNDNINNSSSKQEQIMLLQQRLENEENERIKEKYLLEEYKKELEYLAAREKELIEMNEQYEEDMRLREEERQLIDQENARVQQQQITVIEQQIRKEAAEQIEQVQECLEKEWLNKLEFYEKKHSEILDETTCTLGQQIAEKDNDREKERQSYQSRIDMMQEEIEGLEEEVKGREQEIQAKEEELDIKQREIEEIEEVRRRQKEGLEGLQVQMRKQLQDMENQLVQKYQSEGQGMVKHIEELEGLLVANREAYYKERSGIEEKNKIANEENVKERQKLELELKQEKEKVVLMKNGLEKDKLEVQEMKEAAKKELEEINQIKIEIQEKEKEYQNLLENEQFEERRKRSNNSNNNQNNIRNRTQLKGSNALTDIQEEFDENCLQTPSKVDHNESNNHENDRDSVNKIQRGKNQQRHNRLLQEGFNAEIGENNHENKRDQCHYIDGDYDEESLSEQERESFGDEQQFPQHRQDNQVGYNQHEEELKMMLQEQANQLHEMEEQMEGRTGQFEDEKAQMIQAIEALQQELEFQNNKNNELIDHCQQLEAQTGQNGQYEQQIQGLQNEINEISNESSNLKKEIDRKDRKIQEQLQQIHVLEMNRKEMMDDLEQEQDRFLQQIRNCRESELVQTQEEQINSQKNITALIQERDQLKEQIQELQENQQKYEQMKEQLEQMQSQSNWDQRQIISSQRRVQGNAGNVEDGFQEQGEQQQQQQSDGYSLPFFSQQTQWPNNIKQHYGGQREENYKLSNLPEDQSAEFENVQQHDSQNIDNNTGGGNQQGQNQYNYQGQEKIMQQQQQYQQQHSNQGKVLQVVGSHERVMSEGLPEQGSIPSQFNNYNMPISNTLHDVSSYSENNTNVNNQNHNYQIANNNKGSNNSNQHQLVQIGNNNSNILSNQSNNFQQQNNSIYQNKSTVGGQSLNQSRIYNQFQQNQPLFGSLNHSSLFGLSQAQMLEIIERAYVQRICQQQAYFEEKLRKGSNKYSDRENSMVHARTRLQNENDKLKRELSEIKKSKTLEQERLDIKGREQQLLADTAKLCLQKQVMKKSSTNNSQYLDTSSFNYNNISNNTILNNNNNNNNLMDTSSTDRRRVLKKSISVQQDPVLSHIQFNQFTSSVSPQSQILNDNSFVGQLQSSEYEQQSSQFSTPYSKVRSGFTSIQLSKQPQQEQIQQKQQQQILKVDQNQYQGVGVKNQTNRPLENLYTAAREAAEANKKKKITAGTIVMRSNNNNKSKGLAQPSGLDLASSSLSGNFSLDVNQQQQQHSSRIDQQLKSVSSAGSLTQPSSKSQSSLSGSYFIANTARSQNISSPNLDAITAAIKGNSQNIRNQITDPSGNSQSYWKSTLSTESSNVLKTTPNSKTSYYQLAQQQPQPSNTMLSGFQMVRDTTPTSKAVKKTFLLQEESSLSGLSIKRTKRSVTEAKLFNPSGILQNIMK